MVLDLRENGRVVRRSDLIIDHCPECGNRWSTACPFCNHPLEVNLHAKPPRCLRCQQELHGKDA
jgi:hypothetical protein